MRQFLLSVFSLLAAGAAFADTIPLNEVTVVANRFTDHKMRVPQTVNILPLSLIQSVNPQTTADLLTSDGRLTVQKSQQGGGSPSIRGLESSRVLLMVDGIKLNNLIYRAGHLQNVISIDPSALDNAEVLYGPGSVLYGSDAMGGVVSLQTKQPTLSQTRSLAVSGSGMYRWASANGEQAVHADLNLGTRQFASLTSLSYSRFGDLRSGRSRNPFMPKDDSYIWRHYDVEHIDGKDVLIDNTKPWLQIGSGYHQWDAMQKFLYRPSDALSHALNLQFSTTGDIPRYDRLTDLKKDRPKFAQWYYGPQQRALAAYNLTAHQLLGADYFTAALAWQNVRESRHNRKLNDPWLGSRCESVDVVSLNTDWIRDFAAHRLHWGVDASLQWLRSTASARDINTGTVKALDTRYPDGRNRMHGIDLFVADQWRLSPTLLLNYGARSGYSYLQSTFGDDKFFPIFKQKFGTVTQRNATYSANAGLTFNPVRSWKLALSLSSGYRVPNIDDLGKIFDSQPGMVVVPNPNIKPEKNLSADLNVAHISTGAWSWDASVYATYLFDAIALAPATVDGSDHMIYDGEESKIYANRNYQRAYVVGASTSLTYKFLHGFTADATATYTYGNILKSAHNDAMPLDHVAPLYGRVGLRWQGLRQDRLTVDFYSLFNGSKPLSRYNLNGEDNIVYATTLGDKGQGLPAWYTLNLRATYKLCPKASLQLSCDNLLDTEYRTFASGINAPGRNIMTTLRVEW